MTLRDDLQPVIDDARGLVEDLGLRSYTVTVRTRTWTGAAPGLGTSSDVDLVLDPAPKVREPTARHLFAEPGRYQKGDIVVSRISRDYTEAQLTGGTLTAAQEVFWVVDQGGSSQVYAVVGQPEKRNFEWRVHLRAKARKRGS